MFIKKFLNDLFPMLSFHFYFSEYGSLVIGSRVLKIIWGGEKKKVFFTSSESFVAESGLCSRALGRLHFHSLLPSIRAP